MTKDKELEIQMQFLEEATDYLNTLEGILLEIDTSKRIELEHINAAMRAAHSIKGGAAMMGFRVLSDLAHKLEDAFKVLKTQKDSLELDTHLQSLLLSSVDWLRQIVELLAKGNDLDDSWLGKFCYPIFDELYERLGEPTPEDITTLLSSEDDPEIISLLFETEVEEYLQHLEARLKNSNKSGLRAELVMMATELGGLGEMLQLTAFTQLCQSVSHYLETDPDSAMEIADLALKAWRQSQALVLSNLRGNLPTRIDFGEVINHNLSEPLNKQDYLLNKSAISDLQLLENVELSPESADFVSADSGLASENLPIDYKYTERKTDIHLFPKERENQENTVRVPSKHLEKINDLFGEVIIQRNGLNVQMERLRKLVRNLSQRVQILDQENQELRTAYAKMITHNHLVEESTNHGNQGTENNFIEQDSYQKLNLLSQNVMETIVQVAEVTSDIQLSVDDTDQIARKLNKTSKQLQRQLTQVRMRPFSDLVERFPRAIRDLNVEYGKNVQLKIEGGNTLIERGILEALNEPLMHLLRNAFDHGIEDPTTRRTQGKPEQGLIEMKAVYHSNRTIITIRDDGQGISLEKIRHRALKMGLDDSLLASASDEELLSLIFEPGFSTSEQVTALSGRGVGMDVVRNNLKLARGDVNVDTQAGVGTKFTLSVPFTLSVARVLLVESDRLVLAFFTDVIEEIFLLEQEQIFFLDGKEFINWQNHQLPLLRLNSYFEFNCSRYNNLELETLPIINAISVLIVKHDHQQVAVQVERCWGEQEVAIRQVEGNIPLPSGFNNCTILGDGRVVPLINTNDLVLWITTGERPHISNKLPTTRLQTAFLKPPKVATVKQPSRQKGVILIVDDSINVRRYLALTLEKGGYQVEQAKDGQEALEKLESGLQVQAVICDIEMPRIDGYSFLERINNNTELRNIPVAMLTSRSSSKHRQLAMQLGAKAYFSKPYNEQELLRTLEEIIFQIAETT
ncbi:hybrid sensor histidine kinase/response regulator [Dolichospermum sp. UHCC 0684]|uniref:hybrid sensor histidine kinase/response regulator n=1 Tax=unclassified Dolichospermum TaxID=2622029 RepID=UPI001448920B|nr:MULTISPECIES: hybrid sensor histidine kinase/response regulator [unclassified Dolichospermum]MEA5528825.1 hybrid sensor histidine kinase/response regulator [Dolichospermum sp. UHCC 0684]MTJ33601.1 hybrid sensor histidine kinase/response regulator [Dolichospermum sp. UHCC 0260]